MKINRSLRKLTDNEQETERFAQNFPIRKGQQYADSGKSSVTKPLPYFAIGNDGAMSGN